MLKHFREYLIYAKKTDKINIEASLQVLKVLRLVYLVNQVLVIKSQQIMLIQVNELFLYENFVCRDNINNPEGLKLNRINRKITCTETICCATTDLSFCSTTIGLQNLTLDDVIKFNKGSLITLIK